MNFKKLITSVAMLSIMASVSLAPVANNNASVLAPTAISASAAGKTIADERVKFPDGKYWNHAPNKANNPNGWTSSSCKHHFDCSDDGKCGCNATSNWNIQCMGFADQLAYDIYGTYAQEPDPKCPNKNKYKPWSNEKLNQNSIKKIKCGDVVRDKTPNKQHSFMITNVTGNGVNVVECNRDFKTCKIEWDRFVSNSELTKGCYTIYHAPNEAKKGSVYLESKPALGTVWVEGDTYIFKAASQMYSNIACKTKAGTIPKDGQRVIKRFFTTSNGKDTIGMIDSNHYVYVRKNNALNVKAYVTTNYKTGVNFRSSANTSSDDNIICVIPNGKKLLVTICNGAWAQTRYNGVNGVVNLNVCKG